MRHAAHATRKGAGAVALTKSLFTTKHGAHSAESVYASKAADGNADVLGINPDLARRLNEVAPLTRRAIRESARAAQRKNTVLASASLAALVGTAATSMAFMKADDDTTMFPVADGAETTQTLDISRVAGTSASRSDVREALTADDVDSQDLVDAANNAAAAGVQTPYATQESTNVTGSWDLGETNAVKDTSKLTTAKAYNEKVAKLVDKDEAQLPAGFNPNHATGDTGNAYPWGQCTWWSYERRHQLGLSTGSYFGDARSWGASAQSLGYWVDNQARAVGDVLVFAPGQEGADGYYGHVAIVEAVNPDGSIRISESNAKGLGVISQREFTAEQAKAFTFIHY